MLDKLSAYIVFQRTSANMEMLILIINQNFSMKLVCSAAVTLAFVVIMIVSLALHHSSVISVTVTVSLNNTAP